MTNNWIREFSRLNSPARSLLFSGALNSLGIGLTLPVGIIFSTQVIGVGLALATSTVAMISAGAILGHPIVGWISDRKSPAAGGILALALSVTGSAGFATARSFTDVVVWSVVSGLGLGATTAWFAMLALHSTEQQRSFVFGANQLGINVGVGLGLAASSLLISSASEVTYRSLYGIKAAGYVVVILVLIRIIRCDGSKPEEKSSPYAKIKSDVCPEPDPSGAALDTGTKSGRRLARFGLLTCCIFLVYTFGYVQIESGVVAAIIDSPHLPPWVIAFLMLANTAAVILLNLAVLPLLARKDRTIIAGLVPLVWAVAWVVLGVLMSASGQPAITILTASGAVVFALGEVMYAASIPALTTDIVPPRLRGRAFAAQNVAVSLAFVAGPVMAGPLVETIGASSTLWTLAAFLLVPFAGFAVLAARTKLEPLTTESEQPTLTEGTRK
ncbi:MFS transporter [Arthrobacter sp. UYCu712]|uniref:MFS transporter n=1 Tax=Arthrobacter sp. UYCu712 TaxID=3156340 RepID=UPI003392D8D7